MIERLLSQESSINQLALNKREKEQKKLLLSMARKDHLPMAFYFPHKPKTLLRSSSRHSSRSSARSSARKQKGSSPLRFSTAFE